MICIEIDQDLKNYPETLEGSINYSNGIKKELEQKGISGVTIRIYNKRLPNFENTDIAIGCKLIGTKEQLKKAGYGPWHTSYTPLD